MTTTEKIESIAGAEVLEQQLIRRATCSSLLAGQEQHMNMVASSEVVGFLVVVDFETSLHLLRYPSSHPHHPF